MSKHPEQPSPNIRPIPAAADAPKIDESAAEDGKPADMDYYRVPAKSGAMMMLGTVAMPLLVIVLIGIVLFIAL